LNRASSRFHYAYVVVIVCIFCLIGSLGFGRFSYALLLPSMQREFQANYTQMGSIATSNALAYMLSALVCGLLASKLGARLVISVSLVICAIGLLISGLAQGVEVAAIGQFFCGLGTGGAVGPVYAIANPWFAPHKRGLATGLVQTGSGLGLTFGGFLVPQLLQLNSTGGWHMAWFILGGMVLVVGLVSSLLLRNNPSEKDLLPLGTLTMNPEARVRAGKKEASSAETIRQVYSSLRIWHLGAIFSCFGLSYVVYTVYFAAYLESNGMSSQEAGFIWSLAGMVSIGGSILWGILVDRRGPRFSMVTIMSIQATGLLILSLINSPPGYYIGALAYGLALWGIPVTISYTTALVAGSKMAAAALGLVIVCFSVGQVIGPLLAGGLKDLSGSLVIPMIVASCIAWFGAALSLLVRIRFYSG
jgi:MFS family permease